MNLAKRLTSLGITLLATISLSVPAFAAVADSDSTKATVEFTAGSLSLLSAPTIVEFGTHTISNATQDYQAITIVSDLSVEDLRGSADGWKVTGELSTFEKVGSPGVIALNGAKITFSNGVVVPINGTMGGAPIPVSSVALVSGGSSDLILSAAAGNGVGSWSESWGVTDITLTVYAGTARTGMYQADVIWSLEDTP